jgi:hypothetical protein
MNAKDLALGTFVILTVVLASPTLSEYPQVNTLDTELNQSKNTSTQSTSTLVTTVTTVTTMTISCPMNRICGSFTYNTSGSPVQVNSIEADNESAGGQPSVGFDVEFENIGDYPIYIPGGSYGVSTSVPANSPVLVAYPTQPCSQISEAAKPLNPDQSYALSGPPCGGGVNYAITHAGSVIVALSFNWTTSASAVDFPNSTTISAQFIFP